MFFLAALPWIAGALGLIGAGKAYDAKSDNELAESIRDKASVKSNKAKKSLLASEKETRVTAEAFGIRKLTLVKELKEYAFALKQIPEIDKFHGTTEEPLSVSMAELNIIENDGGIASNILESASDGLATGVSVGVALTGGVALLGSASTGVAISSLSGAAATNATLAYLGGGSLLAGGGGMALGGAVLGGVIAGPAFAILGFSMVAKAEKNYTNAKQYSADVDIACEQVESARGVLLLIRTRIREIDNTITGVYDRLKPRLSSLDTIIKNKVAEKNKVLTLFEKIKQKIFQRKTLDPLNIHNWKKDELSILASAILMGNALTKLLNVKIIDDDGCLTNESEKIIEDAIKNKAPIQKSKKSVSVNGSNQNISDIKFKISGKTEAEQALARSWGGTLNPTAAWPFPTSRVDK